MGLASLSDICYSSSMARQLALDLPKWGGARKGAGRPRTRPHPGLNGPGVPHVKRTGFAARNPVHVTMRVVPGVGYLRSQGRAKEIEAALREAAERYGVRIVHYSIQGNHLHLLVEAEGERALSRAMQGLAIRVARRLNRRARRSGTVFADRYHAHTLRSRREVANAVRYVLSNYRHHTREHLPARWDDPCATREDAPLAAPRTWLLRVGWRAVNEFGPGG
jgi:putative transposase